MYIKRTLEDEVLSIFKQFPVLMITGPRQVGKTTIIEELRKRESIKYEHVTLDDPNERFLAKTDPKLFLENHKLPLFIDEFQYAKELLPYIKIIVDKKTMEDNLNASGLFILTGSQMFKTMKDVSESLAGRVGILNMFSLSNNELCSNEEKPFIPTFDYIKAREKNKRKDIQTLYNSFIIGSMPKMHLGLNIKPNTYYAEYIQTYLERDIRETVTIKDEMKFIKFISSVAARTGQELVYEDLSKDNEIDNKTANNWLSLLVSSGLVYLLQPYHNNKLKSIIKRPKLYFMDMGLSSYLTKWSDGKTLETSMMSGAMFETYVISEIVKSYINNGDDPNQYLYYYRDNHKKEIDLLIVKDGVVSPIEIKKSMNPGRDSIKNFDVLTKTNLKIGMGGVICMMERVLPINEKNNFIPYQCI